MRADAEKPSSEAILLEAKAFHQGFDSLLMATVSPEGMPVASYAPYINDSEGCFYIYVSELAAHTANLLHTSRVSVLFIEDERSASHLFARKRLTYQCVAKEIGRDDGVFADWMDRFELRHGAFMRMMRDLRDFHLFRLQPEHATYVRGFAQAYELSGQSLQALRHRNDGGHQSRSGRADTV